METGQERALRRYIAAEVRAGMARRGMTVESLSGALDVSRAWVSRRLQGDTALDTDDLLRIAAVLNVNIATLLEYPLSAIEAGDVAAAPAPRRRRQRTLAAVTEGAPPGTNPVTERRRARTSEKSS